MIAALLPDLMRSFSVSVAVAGMLVVVYSVAAAFAGFIAGSLSDHYGRRRFLLGGAILFALASWWASETATFGQLMMARALTGAAAGTISTCALTFAGDSFDYAVRGRAIGLISVAYFAAPIIGVPAGAQIADRFGWRATFLFFAFVACLAAASMWLLRNDGGKRTHNVRQPDKLRTTARSMRSFVVRRDLAAGIVIAFLVSGGMVGFLTYIGEWLNRNFDLTTRGIGWVFMLGGLVAVAGSPLGGILADRWGKKSISILGCVILALSLAVMPFFPWGVLLLVVFGFTSLGTAFRQGPVTALMTELIPWSRRGAYMAARGVFSQFGIATTAFVGGLLYQKYGYAAVTGLCAIMTGGVAVMLLAWINEPSPATQAPDGQG